jgi:hypothetical protein
MKDLIGVPLGAGVGILARQVGGRGGMAVSLELLAKLVPAPSAVVGPMYKSKVHAGKNRRAGLGLADLAAMLGWVFGIGFFAVAVALIVFVQLIHSSSKRIAEGGRSV